MKQGTLYNIMMQTAPEFTLVTHYSVDDRHYGLFQKGTEASFLSICFSTSTAYSLDQIETLRYHEASQPSHLQEELNFHLQSLAFQPFSLEDYQLLSELVASIAKEPIYLDFRGFVFQQKKFLFSGHKQPPLPILSPKLGKRLRRFIEKGLIAPSPTQMDAIMVTKMGSALLAYYRTHFLDRDIAQRTVKTYRFNNPPHPLLIEQHQRTFLITYSADFRYSLYEKVAENKTLAGLKREYPSGLPIPKQRYVIEVEYFSWHQLEKVVAPFRFCQSHFPDIAACQKHITFITDDSPIISQH